MASTKTYLGGKIMGVWSCPNTEEKANRLNVLMQAPILQENAMGQLYKLMGDDCLFDNIECLEEGEDIRQ